MAPGVDHRVARPGALAQEVDAVVAERHARGLEIVDPLGDRIAREVDTVLAEPVGAGAERIAVRAERLLAEQVGRVTQGRLDLRAVEHRRPVGAAIADEDDVSIGGEPARRREAHVGLAGTALEPEDRRSRARGAGVYARHGQCDQPRPWIETVLGHDERSAVGGVGAVFGVVGTALEGKVAGLRPRGDGDPVVAGSEAEVREPRHRECDESEGDDSRGTERPCRAFHGASFPGGVDATTVGARHLDGLVGKPDSGSHQPTISRPPQVGDAEGPGPRAGRGPGPGMCSVGVSWRWVPA